jgi:hypothetical protein
MSADSADSADSGQEKLDIGESGEKIFYVASQLQAIFCLFCGIFSRHIFPGVACQGRFVCCTT